MEEPELIEEIKPKIFWKVASLIILFLVISYLLFYPFGFSIVENLIVSYKIKENVVKFSDKTIIFDYMTYKELKEIYFSNERDEFKLCLKGKTIGNLYFINEIFKPKVYFADFNEVVAERCPKDTLIDLHKHPFRQCIFSKQDIDSFNLIKQENDKVLMAVMCEEGRFNFIDF